MNMVKTRDKTPRIRLEIYGKFAISKREPAAVPGGEIGNFGNGIIPLPLNQHCDRNDKSHRWCFHNCRNFTARIVYRSAKVDNPRGFLAVRPLPGKAIAPLETTERDFTAYDPRGQAGAQAG